MQTCIRGTLATCSFELSRSFSSQRLAVMSILVSFPAAMIALIAFAARQSGEGALPILDVLAGLLTALVGILSLLLWASTGVYSELEGKSWIYLACRPYGRISTILGKYLAAVILSYVLCLTALTLALLVAQLNGGVEQVRRFWLVCAGWFLLACLAYAAVFTIIGTLFYRRAMVFCAAYMIVAEGLLASFPAVVKGFTIRYHLQELGLDGFRWMLPKDLVEWYQAVYGDSPQWMNFSMLATIAVLSLAASCYFVINREYLTADET